MSTTRKSPFRALADGGDFKTEIPSEDTHEARVVALIDLGTHMDSYNGEPAKAKRVCLVAFELDEEMTGMKDVNHVVAVKYTASFHEKAALRLLAEAILNDGKKYDSGEIDYEKLLGEPCTVQVGHKKVQKEKGERTYAVIGTIGAVPKKSRAKVFAPKRELTTWYVGDDLALLPTWLPRVYGELVPDIVKRCQELRGSEHPIDDGEGEGEVLDHTGGKVPF